MTSLAAKPLPFTVVRYRCPFERCSHTRSKKAVIAKHIERCWHNPATRSCLTCDHFRPAYGGCWADPGCNCDSPETCAVGEDLESELHTGCPSWRPDPTITANGNHLEST